MTQLSSKVLQKAAEELNDFLDITPRISTKSTDEELSEKILEAASLLVVDGKVNEMLELSKTTQKVISLLQTYVDMEVPDVSYSNMKVGNTSAENEIIASAKEKPKAKMKVVKPTKDEDEEPPLEFEEEEESGYPIKDLPTAVEKADLTELKDIIKRSPDVFVTASKGINLMKDVDKIREKALNDLGARTTEKPAPEKKKPAPETKQTTVKKEKGVSNKSIVWDIFTKQGITEKEQITESFVESTAAQVPDVQKTTVKGWMRSWVDGKNMPACAKK